MVLKTTSRLLMKLCFFVIVVLINAGLTFSQQTEEDYYEKGLEALANKKYNEAVTLFTNFIKTKPDTAVAYFERGNAYYGLENYKLAREDYQKAANMNYYNSELYYKLGLVNTNLKQYSDALDNFKEALDIDPNYKVNANGL